MMDHDKTPAVHLEHEDTELGVKDKVAHPHETLEVTDSEAAAYIDPTVSLDDATNRRIRNKILKHLLPIMCVAYITQSLDKGTLSTAAIMGWQTDVGAVGQDYALTTTFLWGGIIVGEPVVNQLIRRFPVAKLLGICMAIWSILVLGLGFSLSIAPAFVIRFLLGFFESAFSPCLLTITVQYFRTEEQTLLITAWQSMLGASGIVSALIAYGFYHIKGGPLKSWQYMHICLAVISFTASALVLLYLPDTPTQARWATAEEKTMIVERVRKNDQGIKQKVFKKDQAWEAFSDPFAWMLFAMIFLQTLVVGGLNSFQSILINGAFGFDVLTSLLVGMPISIFQMCLYFLAAYIGTKWGQTIYTMILFTCCNIIGTVVLITVTPGPNTRGGLLFCFLVMQAFQSVNPSMNAMLSRNIAGQTKKSFVYALFFIAWAGGNAVAPQLFQAVWKPRYLNSLYIHLGIYALFIGNSLVMRFVLARRNRTRDNALQGRENVHANAFDDLTDLQNPDFRYSY